MLVGTERQRGWVGKMHGSLVKLLGDLEVYRNIMAFCFVIVRVRAFLAPHFPARLGGSPVIPYHIYITKPKSQPLYILCMKSTFYFFFLKENNNNNKNINDNNK